MTTSKPLPTWIWTLVFIGISIFIFSLSAWTARAGPRRADRVRVERGHHLVTIGACDGRHTPIRSAAPAPLPAPRGPRALAFDLEGRVVVGGFEGGRSDIDTLSPIGDATGFVSWFTEAGAPVGSAALETHDADVIEALAMAPDGRIFAAASTLGTLPSQTSGGQYDAVFAVFELGRPGPVQAVQVGGVHPERPHQLVVREDRWIAAGWTDVYVPTNYVEDWEDPIWVEARLGSSGFEDPTVTRWPSPETDFGQAAHLVDDGTRDVIVAHHSAAGSKRGPWVRRLRPDGSEV